MDYERLRQSDNKINNGKEDFNKAWVWNTI